MPDTVPDRVFRLPALAYVAVLFLAFCVTPFAPSSSALRDDTTTSPAWWLVYLVPVAAAVFIARTATVVSPAGLKVRALLGSRLLAWPDVRGLTVQDRAVYAVTDDGAVRLPCVRVSDLHALSAASADHLPEIDAARYKPPRMPRRKR